MKRLTVIALVLTLIFSSSTMSLADSDKEQKEPKGLGIQNSQRLKHNCNQHCYHHNPIKNGNIIVQTTPDDSDGKIITPPPEE